MESEQITNAQLPNETGSNSASPATSGAPSTPLTTQSFTENDVWGTPPPDSPTHSHQLQHNFESGVPSDIPRLRSTHTTAGYRDGVAAARETSVQPGFDEGYLLGSSIGLRAGYLLGVVEGLVVAVEKDSKTRSEPSNSSIALGTDSLQGASVTTDLRNELESMTEALKIENLLSKVWINGDGAWKWEVPPPDNHSADEVTISVVANAHPVIIEWSRRVEDLMSAGGIRRGDGVEVRNEGI